MQNANIHVVPQADRDWVVREEGTERELGHYPTREDAETLVEKLEGVIVNAAAICSAIRAWENRWWQRNLVDQSPDGVSERAKGTLAKAEAMSLTDYRAALMEREAAQLSHARVALAAMR